MWWCGVAAALAAAASHVLLRRLLRMRMRRVCCWDVLLACAACMCCWRVSGSKPPSTCCAAAAARSRRFASERLCPSALAALTRAHTLDLSTTSQHVPLSHHTRTSSIMHHTAHRAQGTLSRVRAQPQHAEEHSMQERRTRMQPQLVNEACEILVLALLLLHARQPLSALLLQPLSRQRSGLLPDLLSPPPHLSPSSTKTRREEKRKGKEREGQKRKEKKSTERKQNRKRTQQHEQQEQQEEQEQEQEHRVEESAHLVQRAFNQAVAASRELFCLLQVPRRPPASRRPS
eukprot:913488-Rhodomonas_salina.1